MYGDFHERRIVLIPVPKARRATQAFTLEQFESPGPAEP